VIAPFIYIGKSRLIFAVYCGIHKNKWNLCDKYMPNDLLRFFCVCAFIKTEGQVRHNVHLKMLTALITADSLYFMTKHKQTLFRKRMSRKAMLF